MADTTTSEVEIMCHADESTIPESVTKPTIHYIKGGGSTDTVKYTAQSLTDPQKAQARTNIGALPATDPVPNRIRTTDASYTDFPAAKVIGSNGDTGHTFAGNIGVVGEANASGSNYGVGVGGVAKTNGSQHSIGVFGRAKVGNTSDTGESRGGTFLSVEPHSGGDNVAVYGSAQNGKKNYSFYGANGELYNAGKAVVMTAPTNDNDVVRLKELNDALGSGSGIAEAPTDGKTYGRKNAAWEEIASGGGSSGIIVGIPVVISFGGDTYAELTFTIRGVNYEMDADQDYSPPEYHLLLPYNETISISGSGASTRWYVSVDGVEVLEANEGFDYTHTVVKAANISVGVTWT